MKPWILVSLNAVGGAGFRAPTTISRRILLGAVVGCHTTGALSSAAAVAALAPAALPPPVRTAQDIPRPRVAAWPGVEYLEPIYELRLSIDALVPAVADQTKWPAIASRLAKFFDPAPLSEQNYYRGLSVMYSLAVKYDEEVDSLVEADKAARQAAMEDTLGGLRRVKELLEAKNPPVPEAVVAEARAAQGGIARWLLLVPMADVAEADALFRAVRTADADGDGRLSESELATMDEVKRKEWKARVALVGD